MTTIALFDADIILYAIGFTTEDVEESEIVASRIDFYLQERFSDLNPDKSYFYLSHSHLFRKDLYPEYKANRADFVKPKWYQFIKDYLINSYQATSVDGYEADDLLRINHTLFSQNNETTVYICSRDKDLMQISGYHYDLHTREICYVEQEEGFKWFLMQVLMGDRTDNIPGIHRCGPVLAKKIVDDHFNDISNGDFSGFISRARELYEVGKVKYGEKQQNYDPITTSNLVFIYERFQDGKKQLSPLARFHKQYSQ